MTLEKRICDLERSNRRMRAAFSVCLCCAVAMILMGASSPAPKVLEAQKIILRDGAGNERGELFATDASAGLILFNKNNSKAAAFVVGSELNALLLFDQNGNIRQSVSSSMDESAWNVYRPGSDPAQFSVLDNAVGTAMTIRDRTSHDRVSLGVSSKGSIIILADAAGAARAIMGEGLGFASLTSEGTVDWSPEWERLTPEERKQLKGILPKLPKQN